MAEEENGTDELSRALSPTITGALERLDEKCSQLDNVANDTENLSDKLTGSARDLKKSVDEIKEERKVDVLSIAETINALSNSIDNSLNRIARSTEESFKAIG